MGNVCTKCFRRKTKYIDKAEPLEEEQLDFKNCYNLTENEKKGINNFLSQDLYENEIKFKRPTAEVECITDGVKTIVEQLMAAVGDKEPLLEISHQYLVGSMAEGTRIEEPDEFDFLVVLKRFSEPGAISVKNVVGKSYEVRFENEDISKYILRRALLSRLENIISYNSELFHVETDHGKLTLNSKIVCHHGPASVVKLLWEPKSDSSKLNIFIDITPCIEQQGIHNVIGSDKKQMVMPDHYKSQILNDDKFMLIATSYNTFEATITTTEVKIVNELSSHHKTCYMLLKYCFNNILHCSDDSNRHDYYSRDGAYRYQTLFPSYLLKTFILRHVVRCESPEIGQRNTKECLFTCLLDIANDLKESISKYYVAGTFVIFKMMRVKRGSRESPKDVIDIVIRGLVEIGQKGYAVDRHIYFRKACERNLKHSHIQGRDYRLARDNVECHLSLNCAVHDQYDIL